MGRDISSRRARATALLWLAASCGCATAQWAKPIGDFQVSVDGSVAVIGAYYEDLTAFERRLYLESAYLDPRQEILFTDASGKPTALSGRGFSAASVNARLDALRLVSAYGRRLSTLAGTEAPTRFASSADVLGPTLTGLATTFEGLAGSDPSAGQYVAPVASLVGVIGRVVLENRRDAAIRLAIEHGDKPVTAILDQVEQDLGTVVGPLRTTGEKQLLAELVSDYNENRKTLSPSERRRRVDSIATASDAYFKAVASNPAAVVAGLRDAHRAMVKYASSSRQPADLGELAAALEIFANRVEAAAAAVRAIRQPR
jgi:hypothetical protein